MNELERIARLEQQVTDLRYAVASMAADVKIVISSLDRLTGGKRALVTLASIAGGVLALLSALWSWAGFGPHHIH